MSVRLFAAVDLTEDARRAIAVEQQRVAASLERSARQTLKWVHVDHMHLTLEFLGEVEDSRVAGLVERMGESIEHPPFAVVFGGLGLFPPFGAPRVLWLGLRAGVPETLALQRAVVGRLHEAGMALENREFHPHLTLARWRSSRPGDRRGLLSQDRAPDVASVDVNHVTLYRSQLSPQGPSYTVLARARLIVTAQ
jgi:RNA 2',3'-cyclic 3'-phosphodiesterase